MNIINFDLNFKLESLDEPEPEKRFQTLSSQEIEQIASERNEKSTSYNTSWGVRLFKDGKSKIQRFPDFVAGEDCMIYVLMKTPTLRDESQMDKEVKVSQNLSEGNTEDEVKFKGDLSEHDYRSNTGRTETLTTEEQDQTDGGECDTEKDHTDEEDDKERGSEADDSYDYNEDNDDDYDNDADTSSEDEDRYESHFLVVKEDLKPMQLCIRKHTESEIEINQAFKIKQYSQSEDMIVIEESSVLRKSGNDRIFRHRVTPQLREDAVTAYRKMTSAYSLPHFNVHGVKHGPEHQIIRSLSAIVTNIYFHVDKFGNMKTHITVTDQEFGVNLKVLINDAHVTKRWLREGSLILLENFKTYRSPRYETNCLVSTRFSGLKGIKSEKLEAIRMLLPIYGCFQVEGKIEEINTSLDYYKACSRSQCFEKKVHEVSLGVYKCPKCGKMCKEYVQGAYLGVSIYEEGHAESKEKEHAAIIFKNSLIKIFKDFQVLPQDQPLSALWKCFNKHFYGKKIRAVIKPPLRQGNSIITSMKLL